MEPRKAGSTGMVFSSCKTSASASLRTARAPDGASAGGKETAYRSVSIRLGLLFPDLTNQDIVEKIQLITKKVYH
jgi:hypothetical protein